MAMGIYSIRNIHNPDLREYIGSSSNLRIRFNQHKSDLACNRHGNIHLQRAWNKYGEQIFVFEILKTVENESDLKNIEQWYLDNYSPHYNLTKDATAPMRGKRHTDEAREKIRIAGTGRKYPSPSKGTRLKMRLVKLGKKLSSEHCKNLSIALLGNKRSVGRIVSNDTRKKLSIKSLGRKHTQATKDKIRQIWAIRKKEKEN